MRATTACPRPLSDDVLIRVFEQVFATPGFSYEWLGTVGDSTTESVRSAAKALGILEADRIAKTLIYRARQNAESSWMYGSAFVPGSHKLDLRVLERTLQVTTAELAPRDDVRRVTGFEPGAMPPLIAPATIDVRLLCEVERDGLVYFSGTTSLGLYSIRYSHSQDPHPGAGGGNRKIFARLFADHTIMHQC